MRRTTTAAFRRQKGHSLLETALLIPLLFSILFNGINIAYFWFMVMTLSATPRLGVQYATQGGQALATTSTPSTTDVKELVYENLTNSIKADSTNAQVRVCSSSKSYDSTSHLAGCDSYGPTILSFSGPDPDPESPVFILHRVDVAYTVTPIIPGTAFNVVLPSTLNFHRQVSMRSLY